MDKINGYSAQEAEGLVEYISEGKKAGKTLTSLFSSYGSRHGRASGSVRNYYYQLLKTKDEKAKRILRGKGLKAEKIKEFSDRETDEMLKNILAERSKGVSVRRAIQKIADGADRLMLRYQNKYRNMLKKQPERIEETAKNMGLENVVVQKNGQGRGKDFLERRLEKEINELYDRLALSLKNENERLKETLRQLNEENELLRRAARAQSENKHA